jgi:hypothetical protein
MGMVDMAVALEELGAWCTLGRSRRRPSAP